MAIVYYLYHNLTHTRGVVQLLEQPYFLEVIPFIGAVILLGSDSIYWNSHTSWE